MTNEAPTPKPRERNLFLAITIPDDVCPGSDDPDDVADAVVALLNRQRFGTAAAKAILDGTYDIENGIRLEEIMVNAIPTPQWLTPRTLANLRAAAADPEPPRV